MICKNCSNEELVNAIRDINTSIQTGHEIKMAETSLGRDIHYELLKEELAKYKVEIDNIKKVLCSATESKVFCNGEASPQEYLYRLAWIAKLCDRVCGKVLYKDGFWAQFLTEEELRREVS